MPGNEVGDKVHNFFAQDNLSHSQHHSQVSGGNWAAPNNNLWVGGPRQIDVVSSNPKDYNPQQLDLERGHNNHSLQVQHGLNSKHPSLRPELTRSQSHNQHPNLNGAIYGRQVFQTRPGEANFLGVDTESDRNDLIERGLSIYESSQGSIPNRLESSESPVSFDLFGGQQQMVDQHPGVLQSLPQQQSGFGDMHQLQQQFMLRKMQELQKQKDLRQLDASQQNSVNQVPFLTRQTSGNHSHALINGTPISDASNYSWATELTAGNTKWLQHASPAIQGSSSGHVFSPEQGRSSRSVGLVHQQVDQSLHGVPVSNSRGSSNQYPHIAADKSPQHMATYSNSFQGNHYAVFPEQVSMQDNRPGFQGKNLFGHTFNQGVNSGINMENLQRLNPPERNVPLQEFQGRQERDSPSEILQEKMAVQAASSQNSVALDPTEEKILFGSDDDSIWDAFGRNTNMSGGVSNLLDGTGFMSGFPSIQSGSWSALMQSAVAETSSSDVGLQEERTGLSFQNPGLPAGNHQPSMYNGTGKRQTALADTNLQISSAFSFGSVPPSDDANLKNNYHTVQGFQRFGQKISQENGERLQNNCSQRPIQQSPPAGGSEWLNCGSQIYGNASHSVDANMNGQNILSNWTPQQSGSSQLSNKPNNWSATESVTTDGDASFDIHKNEKSIQTSQNNDQNRVLHEKLSKKDGVLKVNYMPNSVVELEHLRSTMGTQLNREESSLNNAAAATNLSNARASRETSQFLPNSYPLNNWKHVDTSVKSKGSNRSGKSQHPLNKGPQLVESSLNSYDKEEIKRHETDSFNKTENHNDSYRSNVLHHTSAAGLRENVLSDASDSRSLAGGKQNSSNQVGRKTSGLRKFQYHPMGNLDEDVEPSYRARQATHSQSMHLHKSEGFKSQHQELFGQSKLFGQIPNNSTETGKGQLPDRERDTKGSDEVASRVIPPGYGSNTSSPLDRSVGMITSNKASHTSQHMLELLHKVDQLEERGVVMHFSSSERSPLSETPKSENSDGTGGLLQQNQSSACQGFGLQLAPPSQRLPVSNHVSQSPLQMVNSCTSTLATSDRGDKVQIESSPSTPGQSLPSSHERSQGEFKNNRTVIPGQTACESSVRTIQGNFSSAFNSGFPYSRSQPQDQLMSGARRQGSMNQSTDVPFDRHALPSKQADDSCRKLTGLSAETSLCNAAGSIPYDNAASSANISHPTALNHLHERAPAAQISAGEVLSISQSFTTTGISQQDAFPKKIPNIWTNVPAQQQFLGAQARQVQPKLSQPHQSDIVETTSSLQQSLEDQGAEMRGNIPSELGAGSMHSQGFVCGDEQLTEENPCQQASSVNIDLVQKMNESQRKGAIIQHLPDASPLNSASAQRDIEAFGRSLKPNNFFHQNYSLLNQMRAMKNVETDPSNRDLKRLKGSNTILVGEQVSSKLGQANECNAMVGETLVSRSSVPSGDPKTVSFSESDDYLERNASSSLLGNVSSQDVLMFNQNGNDTASVRIEHSKISPQMAPSWFNQYGTFKNEQMLQMYDVRKANIVKSVEQPFALEKSSSSLHMLSSMEHVNAAADTSQIGHNRQGSTSASLAIENCSLPQSLPPDNVGQQFGVLRPKKRKKATSELQSWNKEVSLGSLNLQTIRIAEADWAKAANRLCEKVENTADMIEDGLPICRARRRRLILTTQLMQQLFRAPPAVILSAGASLNSEIVAYFVARIALGDACSLMSCSKCYSDVHPEGANFQADMCKTSDGIGDLNLSVVMENFMGRVRKLENDLLRPDKRASVLDLRVECQDVEKFSVMNRFAKFHGRWQTDGAETSSSNTAVNAQKHFTQKYVTVVPLPRNLPDRVQCLSL